MWLNPQVPAYLVTFTEEMVKENSIFCAMPDVLRGEVLGKILTWKWPGKNLVEIFTWLLSPIKKKFAFTLNKELSLGASIVFLPFFNASKVIVMSPPKLFLTHSETVWQK